MFQQPEANPSIELSITYRREIEQSYRDLANFSGLHADFIADALDAIEEKKRRLKAPLLGELFPHLVAQGLYMPDVQRRRLAAAWIALYGYITLVDFQLDQRGYLNARTSMSASALLGWGIATMSAVTSTTRFAGIFSENVLKAFAAQYSDQQHQEEIAEQQRRDQERRDAVVYQRAYEAKQKRLREEQQQQQKLSEQRALDLLKQDQAKQRQEAAQRAAAQPAQETQQRKAEEELKQRAIQEAQQRAAKAGAKPPSSGPSSPTSQPTTSPVQSQTGPGSAVTQNGQTNTSQQTVGYTFNKTPYGTVEVFQNGQRIATGTPDFVAEKYGYQPGAAGLVTGNTSAAGAALMQSGSPSKQAPASTNAAQQPIATPSAQPQNATTAQQNGAAVQKTPIASSTPTPPSPPAAGPSSSKPQSEPSTNASQKIAGSAGGTTASQAPTSKPALTQALSTGSQTSTKQASNTSSSITSTSLSGSIATIPPMGQLVAGNYSNSSAYQTAKIEGPTACKAAVFTMIASSALQKTSLTSTQLKIDDFYTYAGKGNSGGATWFGRQSNGYEGGWTNPVANKVTFSDGHGLIVKHPTDEGAFAIRGSTDIPAMLKQGPVMIQGSIPGQGGKTESHWMLATEMTKDGKGMILNDPLSGQQVLMKYSAGKLGPIEQIYDPKQGWIDFSAKNAPTMTNDFDLRERNFDALNNYDPTNYYAVSIHD